MLTPAERARTILATASSISLSQDDWRYELGRHVVDVDGSVLVPARALDDCPAGGPAPLITLMAVDVCPVVQPDRIRGSVTLRGPARPVTRLGRHVAAHLGAGDGEVLRVTPVRVAVDWRCEGGSGLTEVSLEDFVCAGLDALAGWEGGWIEHLGRHHGSLLPRLVRHVDPARPATVGELRPVAADRYGIVVRHYLDGTGSDVRIPFARPVECGCDAVEALNGLLGSLPEAS